jgi:fatty-acid desaturase
MAIITMVLAVSGVALIMYGNLVSGIFGIFLILLCFPLLIFNVNTQCKRVGYQKWSEFREFKNETS